VENNDDRSGQVAIEISEMTECMSPSEQRRYRLPLLLRSARRVAAFSPDCEVCRGLQSQIVSLGEVLTYAPQMTRQNFRNYLGVIKGITKHLKRRHGLAEEKQYVKRYVLMSLTLGLSLIMLGLILISYGITLLSLNVTVPALFTRVVFGFTIGHIRDRRARKLGNVL